MDPKPKRVETPVEGLPPLQRHIATHDAAGTSVYVPTPPPQQYIRLPGTGGVARSWAVGAVPAKLEGDADMKAYLAEDGATSWTSPSIVTPNGVNSMIVDLEPGGVSDMHRTVSIDFSICVIGEILHELDGGETVLLKPGVSTLVLLSFAMNCLAFIGGIDTIPLFLGSPTPNSWSNLSCLPARALTQIAVNSA